MSDGRLSAAHGRHHSPVAPRPPADQYLGTSLARLLYWGECDHSVRWTPNPRLISSWARSAQGVLGWRSMTSWSSLRASAYFLAVSSLGAMRFWSWWSSHQTSRSG